MISFIQGAGRAGRRGQHSVIYLLCGGRHDPVNEEVDFEQRQSLHAMVRDPCSCHRMHISGYMDETQVQCKDLTGAQLCDHCDPRDVSEYMTTIPSHQTPPTISYTCVFLPGPLTLISSNPRPPQLDYQTITGGRGGLTWQAHCEFVVSF